MRIKNKSNKLKKRREKLKYNKAKNWFFDFKIDKPLARLILEKRKKNANTDRLEVRRVVSELNCLLL